MLTQVVAEYPRLVILVLVVFVGWSAVFVLFRAQRGAPTVFSLKDSLNKATFNALALTISLVVFSNMRLGYPWWDEETNLWVIFFVIVGISIPNFIFLFAYFTGRFARQR